VGSNGEVIDMLQFAAAHKIAPRIEAFALKDVNDALARLRENQMRYRAVLMLD
jgi:uncharacterized zinc-type alcohol dehydrogenase-like protein